MLMRPKSTRKISPSPCRSETSRKRISAASGTSRDRSSLREDFRARTSRSRAKESASMARDQGSGVSLRELSERSVPITRSSKTSRASQARGSIESYRILPTSGAMRSGRLYRRDRMALATSETGYGLLPTPCAIDADGGYSTTMRCGRIWPTAGTLAGRLRGIAFGLTGREKQKGSVIANPWFVEKMMGYPDGWTETEV